MSRLVSLALLLALWQGAAMVHGGALLPSPAQTWRTMAAEAKSGALLSQNLITLLRVLASFSLAMLVGTALGVLMGRQPVFDRFADPLLVILMNVPALVIIILAYVWAGLGEGAAIAAVALNKLPQTAVTMREGARALDPDLAEMARVFQVPRWRSWRHCALPQLAPYLAAAARSGLSLVWKIVLVVELLGRPNGVGFEMGMAFQLFDLRLLFAYSIPFIAIMLALESFALRPLEQYASRWRRHAA